MTHPPWPSQRRRLASRGFKRATSAPSRLSALPALPALSPAAAASDPEERIQGLALTFPTLRWAAGVQPWQPHGLDAWACGSLAGEGALHAARFVLALWNNAEVWCCGRFDAIEALSVWDGPHRGAFLTWVARPWWA